MIYNTKSKTNLYLGADFSYDMLSLLYRIPEDTNITSIFGLKLRVGASMLKGILKTYFTFGLIGFNDTYYSAGKSSVLGTSFMPVFGVGLDRSILNRRLSMFIELEGGPTTGSVDIYITGVFLIKGGLRALF